MIDLELVWLILFWFDLVRGPGSAGSGRAPTGVGAAFFFMFVPRKVISCFIVLSGHQFSVRCSWRGHTSCHRTSWFLSLVSSTHPITAACPIYLVFVFLTGDRESGKTTLVAKLQGNVDPKKGSGLEYAYIDVRDEYRDGTNWIFPIFFYLSIANYNSEI